MKIKRILSTVLCFVTIITSVGCSSAKTNSGQVEKDTLFINADFPSYDTVENLTTKASVIIRGTILSSKVVEMDTRIITNDKNEKSNPNYNAQSDSVTNTPYTKKVYTVYAVKVNDSYKGEFKSGDTIEIKQLGGEINGQTYVLEDSIEFMNNKKYIMFLETYPNSPACLLNQIQATYIDEVDGGNFKNANKKNNLKFSTKSLDEIKQKNK
jgi:hypothetical protein